MNLYSIIKCLLDEDCQNDDLFTDDIDKLKFDEDRTNRFLSLVNECSNSTSREELLKRLKYESNQINFYIDKIKFFFLYLFEVKTN